MSHTKRVQVQDLPEKAAVAAYELIATAYEEDVSVLNIELTLTDDGKRVGRFEISIRRIA